MKVLNVTFEDKEFDQIEKVKKDSKLIWHDFILKKTLGGS